MNVQLTGTRSLSISMFMEDAYANICVCMKYLSNEMASKMKGGNACHVASLLENSCRMRPASNFSMSYLLANFILRFF